MPSASNRAAFAAPANQYSSGRKSQAAPPPLVHCGAAATNKNTTACRQSILNRSRSCRAPRHLPPPVELTENRFPTSTSSPAPTHPLRTPRSLSCVRVERTGPLLFASSVRTHALFFRIVVQSIPASSRRATPRAEQGPFSDSSVPSVPDIPRTPATPLPRSLPTATRFLALFASLPHFASITAELCGQIDVD